MTSSAHPTAKGPQRERGDALVVFCVAMIIVILPLGGISLDLWHAISEERTLQSAADAAGVAGASESMAG